LSGADTVCNSIAGAIASLAGTYVAYVTRNGVNVNSRLGAARGFIRPDGKPFADSLASPTYPGQIFYPPALDEYGAYGESWDVLTGAAMDGSAHSNNCLDWTLVDSTRQAQTGVRGAGSYTWSSYYQQGCDQSFRLLCLGVDHTVRVTVPAPPAKKRVVFITSNGFSPNAGGLSTADMACAINASVAGLSGTFKAMLATTSASIASRFTPSGVPVVRPDGVWVSPPTPSSCPPRRSCSRPSWCRRTVRPTRATTPGRARTRPTPPRRPTASPATRGRPAPLPWAA
jgi:hypothetical protein